MKNFKALVQLDFKLLAPYWKWWLMFFGFSLLMSIANQDGYTFIISLPMFAGTMMAFPFESTDKSNLNVLYTSLPTNRKTQVSARYGFILISLVITIIISIITALIVNSIFDQNHDFNVYIAFIALSFGIFLTMTGFQTPFFYKIGYTKGKIFMWIPIIVVVVLMNVPALLDIINIDFDFNIFEMAFRNTTITSIVSIITGIVVAIVSYLVSYKIYLKRDF